MQYGGRQAVMSDELLELYVKQYIEANEVPTVQFCWHGGEPLLLGVDFYRKAMDFQQKYADGKKIENILQTNGTGNRGFRLRSLPDIAGKGNLRYRCEQGTRFFVILREKIDCLPGIAELSLQPRDLLSVDRLCVLYGRIRHRCA